jgi:uncharacterized membrane protein YqjE
MATPERPAGATTARAGGVDLRTEPKAADQSLGELVGEMTSDLSTLMRKEVELAKLELKEEAQKAGKAAGMLGAGGVSAYFAVLFASFALAWLLNEVMHVALAFLVVAVLYGIAAAVLAKVGRDRLQDVNPVPEQTVETLKDDAAWVRAQKS